MVAGKLQCCKGDAAACKGGAANRDYTRNPWLTGQGRRYALGLRGCVTQHSMRPTPWIAVCAWSCAAAAATTLHPIPPPHHQPAPAVPVPACVGAKSVVQRDRNHAVRVAGRVHHAPIRRVHCSKAQGRKPAGRPCTDGPADGAWHGRQAGWHASTGTAVAVGHVAFPGRQPHGLPAHPSTAPQQSRAGPPGAACRSRQRSALRQPLRADRQGRPVPGSAPALQDAAQFATACARCCDSCTRLVSRPPANVRHT